MTALTLKLAQLDKLVCVGRTGNRDCRPLATCALSYAPDTAAAQVHVWERKRVPRHPVPSG